MDWRLFVSTFALIAVAELPGKTTFASALLSARARPIPVFLGACCAFVIHSLIAVMAGSLINFLPARLVQTTVGILFLVLAILLWREKADTRTESRLQFGSGDWPKIMTTAFTVIFLAQWGDPTQIATAALAAKYRAPWTIMLSATLALWTVSGVAVAIGHFAKRKIDFGALQKIAAIVFASVGLLLLTQALGRFL